MASPDNSILSNIFEKSTPLETRAGHKIQPHELSIFLPNRSKLRSMFLTGSIKFLKIKRVYFLVSFFLAISLPIFILAETVFFEPANLTVPKNTNFSLPLKISSANNLFAVSFDLSFNSSLVEYVSTTEGNFLSQGCGTAMLVRETSPGRLVFGITRLGASCGGVSGSGTIATLNFRSTGQDGINNLIFSNNSLCILNGMACNYIAGVWTNTIVTVGTPDIAPPIISAVSISSATANSATINWTTNEPADSQVEYGLFASYGQQTNLNFTLTTNHNIIINGLSAVTLYHFRVLSKDGSGNAAASADYTFSTAQESSGPCPAGASQRR